MVLVPTVLRERDRDSFRAFCLRHMRLRSRGGYISDEGARKLRRSLCEYLEEAAGEQRSLHELAVLALDRLAVRRVTSKVLEAYRLIAMPVKPPMAPSIVDVAAFVGPCQEYPAGPVGHSYNYMELLDERIVDGDIQVLVAWEPTWELVENIHAHDLRGFRDSKRTERRMKRQRANEDAVRASANESSSPVETDEAESATADAVSAAEDHDSRPKKTKKKKNKKRSKKRRVECVAETQA